MDTKELRRIYDRTNGHCHICQKKLSFSNYGKSGQKGAWNREHSKAKFNGGTDHLNNLYAACISCNIQKGIRSSNSARRKHGHSSAPFSKSKVRQIKEDNTVAGALLGGTIGALGGPVGIAIGSALGGIFGNNISIK